MLQGIGISDFVDIACMSTLIYFVIIWFKKTRAAFVLTGIVIMGFIYLMAQIFNLYLTVSVLQGFFAVILIALVIIFHDEIRRFFEQVALWGITYPMKKGKSISSAADQADMIVRTVVDLANEKIGAIIVIRGKNMVLGHLGEGVVLNGHISEELLKSISDPHSVGHDGAIIIENNLVTQFGAHLPLSSNFRKLGLTGTRHAAALGLSEKTDALCIVVSEESGEISTARNGSIGAIDGSDELSKIIERFHKEINPQKEKKSLVDYFRKNSSEKAVALLLAILLWFVHVYGSEIKYRNIEVPITYAELPSNLAITNLEPKQISLTFSGMRRSLYFLNKGNIKITMGTLNLKEGSQYVHINQSNVIFPMNLKLEAIDPAKVKVDVSKPDEN